VLIVATRHPGLGFGGRALTALAAFGLAAAAPASAAAAAIAIAKQGTDKFDPDFVLGRWTDKGDCSDWVTFLPDGRFTTISGGAGVWELDGNRLTLTGGSGIVVLHIYEVDRDTMTIVNPDNSVGRSIRC
jgi:hypothetical protein